VFIRSANAFVIIITETAKARIPKSVTRTAMKIVVQKKATIPDKKMMILKG
jgi:hypothetical protein